MRQADVVSYLHIVAPQCSLPVDVTACATTVGPMTVPQTSLLLQVSAKLQQLEGVVVVPRDEKLKKKHTESRIWNETWLAAFFHKPCNHELFVMQSLNMEGEPLAGRERPMVVL